MYHGVSLDPVYMYATHLSYRDTLGSHDLHLLYRFTIGLDTGLQAKYQSFADSHHNPLSIMSPLMHLEDYFYHVLLETV